MREIKFRVWHEPSKLMLKVWKLHHDGFVSVFNREALDNGYCDCSGDPMDTREKRHITQNGGELSSKHPVMQYTGLKDKNGVDIYAGDVVSFVANYSSKPCGYMNGMVEFKDLQWLLTNKNGSYSIMEETDEFYAKSEVIGNIYENPEFLKCYS